MTDAAVKQPTAAELAANETTRATAMLRYVEELVVDAGTLEIASADLVDIVTRRKHLEAARMNLTRPLDQSKAGIIALFKVPDSHLETAENKLRAAIGKYQREAREAADRARRQEEQRLAEERSRARADAEKKQRELEVAQAAETAASSSGDTAAVEQAQAATDAAADAAAAAGQRLDVAEVAPLQAPVVANVAKAAGIGGRTNWKFDVADVNALIIAAAAALQQNPPNTTLAAYLSANTVAIGATVKALKRNAIDQIPGVKVYAEEALSVRTKR